MATLILPSAANRLVQGYARASLPLLVGAAIAGFVPKRRLDDQ